MFGRWWAALRRTVAFGNHLYLVTGNSTSGGEVWCTENGTTWEQVRFGGWGDSNNWGSYWSNPIADFGGRLFVGTAKPDTGGCEVWLYLHNTVFLPVVAKQYKKPRPYEPGPPPCGQAAAGDFGLSKSPTPQVQLSPQTNNAICGRIVHSSAPQLTPRR